MRGFLLTAPSSGAGKTTLTLGILRALTRKNQPVQPAKSGPDYIDPAFHGIAAGRTSINLDAWAMKENRLKALADTRDLLVVEGAMGLFDGAGIAGSGSAAHLAHILDLPFVLVLDCAKQSHSIRAIVRGVLAEAAPLTCCGIILNNVGSLRHEEMLRSALKNIAPPILGTIPRRKDLRLPERHLGLVQASEIMDLDHWLDGLADLIDEHIDLSFVDDLTDRGNPSTVHHTPPPPPAQTIAVAQDVAFSFAYPHMLKSWQDQGAQVTPFSPLADEKVPEADLVFLPGGYPELHAGKISSSQMFLSSLRKHAETKRVYGECGGYMTLGRVLIDAEGTPHPMAGLLDLETSFQNRKLHLGYRQLRPLTQSFSEEMRGHEFHYATTLRAQGDPLFGALDADGQEMANMGLQNGTVCGSFAHIIDGF